MSEAAEPLAVDTADAAPVAESAPTIDQTMEATLARIEEREAAPTEEAPAEGPQRGPDGRFLPVQGEDKAAEPVATEQAPTPATEAPTVPEYIAPYVADLSMRGIAPQQAVPYLLDTWRSLERDPAGTLQWLGSRYGLQVNFGGAQQPEQPAQQAGQEAWVDPAILQVREELNQLKAEREREMRQVAYAQQQAYENAYKSVSNEVAEFEKSKAGDGADFSVLRPLMSLMLGSGQADSLEQAYDMAVNAHPTTRAAREAAARQQSEAAAAKASAEKAAAARRAASINVRSDTASPARGRTIDETMTRVLSEIQSRG